MNSFIGWVGGKNHLKKQIMSLTPENTERYIEKKDPKLFSK